MATASQAAPSTSAPPTMTKAGHYLAPIDFPVYALCFIDERTVALAGGGGAGRSGVKNTISLRDLDPATESSKRVGEALLSKEEDAPMTICHRPSTSQLWSGVNSPYSLVEAGTSENANLRVFSYCKTDASLLADKEKEAGANDEYSLESVAKHATLADRKSKGYKEGDEPYQKVTAVSRDGSLLAVASSAEQLSVLRVAEGTGVERIYGDVVFEGEEMYDADFSEDGQMILGASTARVCIYPTTASTSGTSLASPPEPLQVIESPRLSTSLKCTFRAARFGRGAHSSRLYTIVNALPSSSGGSRQRGSGGGKKGEKKAFLSVWDTQSWSLVRTRTIARKPVTSFDVSSCGRYVAIGGSDLSVTVFDAANIRPLMSVLKAHDLPSTCLRFSPDSSLLVSGSADNTLRVISLHSVGKSSSYGKLLALLITLLVLASAVLFQFYLPKTTTDLAVKQDEAAAVPSTISPVEAYVRETTGIVTDRPGETVAAITITQRA